MNTEELLWDQIHRQQEMIDSLLGMCDNLNARIVKMEKQPKVEYAEVVNMSSKTPKKHKRFQ